MWQISCDHCPIRSQRAIHLRLLLATDVPNPLSSGNRKQPNAAIPMPLLPSRDRHKRYDQAESSDVRLKTQTSVHVRSFSSVPKLIDQCGR